MVKRIIRVRIEVDHGHEGHNFEQEAISYLSKVQDVIDDFILSFEH